MNFVTISFDNYDNNIIFYNNNLSTSNLFIIFIPFNSQSAVYNNLINFIYFNIFNLFLIDTEFFNIFINFNKKSRRNKRARFEDLKFKY